jgi:hypothetical protein
VAQTLPEGELAQSEADQHGVLQRPSTQAIPPAHWALLAQEATRCQLGWQMP